MAGLASLNHVIAQIDDDLRHDRSLEAQQLDMMRPSGCFGRGGSSKDKQVLQNIRSRIEANRSRKAALELKRDTTYKQQSAMTSQVMAAATSNIMADLTRRY